MITVVQGPGGSGKSYWATRHGIGLLKKGVHIYTNLPLHPEKVIDLIASDGWEVPLDLIHIVADSDIPRLDKVVGAGEGVNVCVIVDETHLQLNARDFAKQSRSLMNWASVSRHYRADLIFISQHRHNIDAQIRRLANQYISMRNFQEFQFSGFTFAWFPYFRANVIDTDERTVLATEWIKKDKRIYSVYDSYSMAVGSAAEELVNVTPVKKKHDLAA